MKEVVINNLKRTEFYGYCDNYGKRCEHWRIEFPKSELGKLAPFSIVEREVKFEYEDDSVEDCNCSTVVLVKNHRFIYNDRPCNIFTAIGFRTNERGEEVCHATAFFPIQN